MSDPLPTLVIGGGISGLVLAERLASARQPVRLFESTTRLGGAIRTFEHDGYLYDAGPDAMLAAKSEARTLIERLGLADDLVRPLPGAARVYVAHDGRLHPMPEGLALGVPTRPSALVDTELLSFTGKLRACCEPFVPRRIPRDALDDAPNREDSNGDESILSFATRRVGAEMAERIVGPLLSGVFAGDPAELGIEACFPQLARFEREAGSLLLGTTGTKSVWGALTREKKAPVSPFLGLRRGLGSLVAALEAALPSDVVTRGAIATHVSLEGDAGAHGARALSASGAPPPKNDTPSLGEPVVRVHFADGSSVVGQRLVIAGPPWLAARLLGACDAKLAALLGEVRGNPTATVVFGFDQAGIERSLDGSGFIVPPGEGDVLASTWISSKWAGRAPRGKVVLRAFLGGARPRVLAGGALRAVSELDDRELAEVAYRELSRFMGSLGRPEFERVVRYERGSPQPDVRHLGRVAAIRGAAERHANWLSLIGPGYGGVGIPDCIRGAEDLAARLLEG